MTDTIELTTVRLTATLRGDDLPPGDYRLRTGRCVVELAVWPVLRARVEALSGALTVGELTTLELDLVPETRRARYLAADLDEPLALRARSVFLADDTVVLSVSGPLAGRWSRVFLAAEFVR